MSGIFSQPKAPAPMPVVDPAQTTNRLNDAMAKRLAAGGSNSTLLSAWMGGGSTGGATGVGKSPTLTGLS